VKRKKHYSEKKCKGNLYCKPSHFRNWDWRFYYQFNSICQKQEKK
jgi:hypothetical protein